MPLSISEEKPIISDFLLTHKVGVLATANSENQPHAATVYFTVDTDLSIYFLAKERTTKVKNMRQNPKVAFAVYEPKTQTTVQISGTVEEIKDQSRMNEVFRRIQQAAAETSESAIPPVSKIDGGQFVCLCIRPKVLRMANYTKPEQGQAHDLFDVVAVPDASL